MDAADLAIRSHSDRQNRSLHVTSASYGYVRIKRYYCDSLATNTSSNARAARFTRQPQAAPKGMESEEQKSKREARCRFYIIVKQRHEEKCLIISDEDVFPHTCAETPPVQERRRKNSLMSKNVTKTPNIHNVMKDHSYKITKDVIQNELLHRNALNRTMKLKDKSAVRAIKR